MKTPALAVISFVLMLLVSGCTSGPQIKSDYDRSVDFSEYRTYGFFPRLSIEDQDYSTSYGSIFRDAISREMNARGYIKSDDPDLLINVSGRLTEKTDVRTMTDPFPMYYRYRAGFYQPWYGYGYGARTHVSQYTEGTVNVDVVDADEKKMIFEGVGVGRLRENRTSEQIRAAINSAVARMFEGYPATAGG